MYEPAIDPSRSPNEGLVWVVMPAAPVSIGASTPGSLVENALCVMSPINLPSLNKTFRTDLSLYRLRLRT